MFDCYHVHIMEGDVLARLETCLPYVGHIQIAGYPGRGCPDRGEINYGKMFDLLATHDWDRPVGAEYVPTGAVEDSLGWMESLRNRVKAQ